MKSALDLTAELNEHRILSQAAGVLMRSVMGRQTISVGLPTPLSDLYGIRSLVAERASAAGRPLVCVEVGSWVGESALAIHAGLGKPGGVIFCVDTWKGSPNDASGAVATHIGTDLLLEVFEWNLSDLVHDVIIPVRGYSCCVADEWMTRIDFLYLDAGHEEFELTNDLNAWYPHMAEGGIMCGHDIDDPMFPGVRRAIDKWCRKHNKEYEAIEGTRLWATRL